MKKVRKQFIVDTVEMYMKNYPEEYQEFLEYIASRKIELNDRNFGKLKGTSELRVGISLPRRIYDIFSYVLKGEEKVFGEEKGEMKWFAKKYPQFVVPNKY